MNGFEYALLAVGIGLVFLCLGFLLGIMCFFRYDWRQVLDRVIPPRSVAQNLKALDEAVRQKIITPAQAESLNDIARKIADDEGVLAKHIERLVSEEQAAQQKKALSIIRELGQDLSGD